MEPQNQTNQLDMNRQKLTVELRRNNRNQTINSRRQKNIDIDNKQVQSSQMVTPELTQKIRKFLLIQYEQIDIDQSIEKFKSDDIFNVHQGLIMIRKYLSADDKNNDLEYRIQKVIDANVVIKIIELMKQTMYPRLQLESAWTITNLVAENNIQCRSVVNKGAIPILLSLLDSKDHDLVQQVVWGIGNLSADSIQSRDLLLKHHVIEKLTRIIKQDQKYQTVKNCAWTLSNLCRVGNIPPNQTYLKQLASPLFQLLANQKIQDISIINDMIWSFVILTDYKYNIIPQFNASKVLQRIVQLFYQMANKKDFVTPILSIFGNLALGQDSDAAELLKYKDLLKHIEQKLTDQQKTVRQQALRFFQSFSTGPQSHIAELRQCQNLIPKIVQILDKQPDLRVSSICTLTNLLSSHYPSIQVVYFNLKVYIKVVQFLSSSSVKIISSCLDCIYLMLVLGQQLNKTKQNGIKTQLEKAGLIDKLQDLQLHKSSKIYQQVSKIISRFYESQ